MFTSCDELYFANCRNADEVSNWLSQKYIILLYTESRFSHESGDAIESTKLLRIPLNGVANTHYTFQLETTHLMDLDPGILPFSTKDEREFYSVLR